MNQNSNNLRYFIFFLLLEGGVISLLFFPLFALADAVDTSATVIEEETTPPPAGGGGLPAQWFMPPKAPEGGFRILINDGAEYTDSLIVNLTLFGGPDIARMAISNFSDFRDVRQELYTTTKQWDLCRGRTSCPEGEYTVYAKFYAPWGTASETVSDGIIYKKPIPQSLIEQIRVKIKEISRKIAEFKKQITELLKKEKVVTETPEIPPEEISPGETPPEQILPPVEEITTPLEEILPKKEQVKPKPIQILKEYGRWFWQKIISFWQKIWPF